MTFCSLRRLFRQSLVSGDTASLCPRNISMGCKSLLLPSSLNTANVSSSPLSKPQSHPLLLLPPTSSPSYPPLPPYSLRISRRSMVACYAAASSSPSPSSASSPARELRKLLESPGAHQGPPASTPSAPSSSRGPASASASRAIKLSITQAVSIPVIGDGDNGYGNQMNVKRTVKGLSSGFCWNYLEDQFRQKPAAILMVAKWSQERKQ
ncbi:hypothetical protein ACMD2_21672 [Ananas comosus]|uniref:Uncharacterized protein n=1 Tax=Ananas comosus TaxID=4615 RepID=A0A199V3T4_ANACO|nr:hypothetical protein ACMD2_21672 [Ananas comosus]